MVTRRTFLLGALGTAALAAGGSIVAAQISFMGSHLA